MRWLSGKTLRKCIAWAKFFQAGHKPFLVTLKMHNVTTNTIYKYSWFVNSKVMEQLFEYWLCHVSSLDILFKIKYSWEETVSENNTIMVNITGNTMDVYLGKENAFWKDFISR